MVRLKIGESIDLSCFSNSVYRPSEILFFYNDVNIKEVNKLNQSLIILLFQNYIKKQIVPSGSGKKTESFKKIRIENATKAEEGVYECRAYFSTPDANFHTISKITKVVIGEK